ncbi:Ca2+ transporter [Xylogone sp. PMI_703]|nr:Ca2+ transporter [Xylogone sp. PMI_703]
MFTRNGEASDPSNSDGDDADVDPDQTNHPLLPSTGEDLSQDELIEMHPGSPLLSDTSLDSHPRWHLRSWLSLAYGRIGKNSQQHQYNTISPSGNERFCTRRTIAQHRARLSKLLVPTLLTIRTTASYTWLNILFVFVPIGAVSYFCKAHPSIVFTSNAIAIIPLSGLLTFATEVIANNMGDAIGALMNITFGNLIEVVILMALLSGQLRVVQASLLGSVLVNLLFIFGTAIVAGGVQHGEQSFDIANAQALACLLGFSVFSLLVPTAFYHSFSDKKQADQSVLELSRASALVLLAIYCLYLIFQLKSHSFLFCPSQDHGVSTMQQWQIDDDSRSTSGSFPHSFSFGNTGSRSSIDSNQEAESVMELDMVDHGEPSEQDPETGDPALVKDNFCHIHPSSAARNSNGDGPLLESAHRKAPIGSTSGSLRVPRRPYDYTSYTLSHHNFHETGPSISKTAALFLLVSSSALVAACAEFLVDTIDDMVAQSPLSKSFIGLIILPIAGNVAEHITSLTVATKGKMDLAISVSLGSSIQISLFVTPIVVIMGWFLDQDMTLHFSIFETVTLVAAAFLVSIVIVNGRTNYLEGGLLFACYFILAVGAYLLPRIEEQTSD